MACSRVANIESLSAAATETTEADVDRMFAALRLVRGVGTHPTSNSGDNLLRTEREYDHCLTCNDVGNCFSVDRAADPFPCGGDFRIHVGTLHRYADFRFEQPHSRSPAV